MPFLYDELLATSKRVIGLAGDSGVFRNGPFHIPEIFLLPLKPKSTLLGHKIGSQGAVSIEEPCWESAESISSIGVPQMQHFWAEILLPSSKLGGNTPKV